MQHSAVLSVKLNIRTPTTDVGGSFRLSCPEKQMNLNSNGAVGNSQTKENLCSSVLCTESKSLPYIILQNGFHAR